MNDLSVVIPCCDDIRIGECVQSIDDDVEIVISLNGSNTEVERVIEKLLPDKRITIVKLPLPNLAEALQEGTLAASSEAVLYMDSDCRFLEGTIRRFRRAIANQEVVKGHIIFRENSLMSSIIASSREHHTSEQITAYKPPLAIRLDIKDRIGGYFFDRRLLWREDSDLDYRIRKAGIFINYDEKAVISHPPLSLKEDLRSSYRYGVGLARARWFDIELTEIPRSVLSTYRSKGAITATYMCLRNTIYNTGTFIEYCNLVWENEI